MYRYIGIFNLNINSKLQKNNSSKGQLEPVTVKFRYGCRFSMRKPLYLINEYLP